jgi:hypothetical protein
MSLSWNEVKDRAIKFTRQWANETSERAEAKTFWDEFFGVFGIPRPSPVTASASNTSSPSTNNSRPRWWLRRSRNGGAQERHVWLEQGVVWE